ncbi:MAG: hypothetical protein PVI59_07350 [Anaerolineae bacterium]
MLALSDSDLLLQVIEINLDHPVHGISLDCREPALHASDFDLIILALSESSNDAATALSRIQMIDQLGQTPVLVISDHRPGAGPERRIYYLPFPFDAAVLRRRVRALLE